jgi:ribulose 1,5-bisphosphate synthetase/thiazole synthase
MRYFGWCLAVAGAAAGGKQDALDGSIFDYVVVGGGTSGLVVANRLTEDRRSKYLEDSLEGRSPH